MWRYAHRFVAKEPPDGAKLTGVIERWILLHPEVSGRWRQRLADVVWLVHIAIAVVFSAGCALPSRSALWTTAFGALALRIHWWMNGNTSVLTQLERHLRRPFGSNNPDGLAFKVTATEPNFIFRSLRALIGSSLSPNFVDGINARRAADRRGYRTVAPCADVNRLSRRV